MQLEAPWHLGSAMQIRRAASIAVGRSCVFHEGCQLWPTDDPTANPVIIVGCGNAFGRRATIEAHQRVEIGNDNIIGPDAYIVDSDHDISGLKAPIRQGVFACPVRIGSNCWIGAKAIILKGVQLGDGCVVGAGAVVTKSFGPDCIVGGVPARLIGVRKVTASQDELLR